MELLECSTEFGRVAGDNLVHMFLSYAAPLAFCDPAKRMTVWVGELDPAADDVEEAAEYLAGLLELKPNQLCKKCFNEIVREEVERAAWAYEQVTFWERVEEYRAAGYRGEFDARGRPIELPERVGAQ